MPKTTNLTYQYSKQERKLFSDINLEFNSGKVYAIIGRSGAGKTTFLSLLAGLDSPTAGKIEYQGKDLKKIGLSNYRRNDTSMVFQAYNLFDYMTAVENILTALDLTSSSHRGNRAFVLELLKKIGIDEQLANKKIGLLSGGQQQRVAIARAMACDAKLILADEPTGNLDEQNTQEVVKLLLELAHKEQRCVIIVTHENDVAERCDVQIELRKGKLNVIEGPNMVLKI